MGRRGNGEDQDAGNSAGTGSGNSSRHLELPDFDTMVKMHQQDPEALEKIRLELTGALVENAPDNVRRRLEGLQFRINMELRRARTPEARCIRMSSMMHDSFAKLNHCLHHPYEAGQDDHSHKAEILKLKPDSGPRLN